MEDLASNATSAKNLLSRKTCVHLMRVDRCASRHEFLDWSVEVLISAPDSAQPPGTDVLQATVTALAQESTSESMEDFAQELLHRLLQDSPQIVRAEVNLASHLWKRLIINGDPSPTAFMKGSDERQTTHVTWSQHQPLTIYSGFAHMTVLRTSLLETDEVPPSGEVAHTAFQNGLLYATIAANWQYKDQASPLAFDYNNLRSRIRERCIAAFARQGSQSLHQSPQAIAAEAMNETDLISEITLRVQHQNHSKPNASRSTRHTVHIVLTAEASPPFAEFTLRRA